ncbi:hypothetical protein GGR52DRAFT_554490 [Hypoxylon sp. FL1284]|nr:hypothetical protein GGR52DRAFT_554490 [Hypoxylon sp. FL1284]
MSPTGFVPSPSSTTVFGTDGDDIPLADDTPMFPAPTGPNIFASPAAGGPSAPRGVSDAWSTYTNPHTGSSRVSVNGVRGMDEGEDEEGSEDENEDMADDDEGSRVNAGGDGLKCPKCNKCNNSFVNNGRIKKIGKVEQNFYSCCCCRGSCKRPTACPPPCKPVACPHVAPCAQAEWFDSRTAAAAKGNGTQNPAHRANQARNVQGTGPARGAPSRPAKTEARDAREKAAAMDIWYGPNHPDSPPIHPIRSTYYQDMLRDMRGERRRGDTRPAANMPAMAPVTPKSISDMEVSPSVVNIPPPRRGPPPLFASPPPPAATVKEPEEAQASVPAVSAWAPTKPAPVSSTAAYNEPLDFKAVGRALERELSSRFGPQKGFEPDQYWEYRKTPNEAGVAVNVAGVPHVNVMSGTSSTKKTTSRGARASSGLFAAWATPASSGGDGDSAAQAVNTGIPPTPGAPKKPKAEAVDGDVIGNIPLKLPRKPVTFNLIGAAPAAPRPPKTPVRAIRAGTPPTPGAPKKRKAEDTDGAEGPRRKTRGAPSRRAMNMQDGGGAAPMSRPIRPGRPKVRFAHGA